MADVKMESRAGMTLFSILFTMFALGQCSDQVPVVIWSSESSLWQSQDAPALGHVVSGSQLVTYLSSAVSNGPRSVLLFLQDKLSLDDFTMYGGAFGNKQDNAFPNLEAALEMAPSSLVLPSVDWHASSAVPALLQEKLETSPVYLEPSTLRQLRLNHSISSLLVLRLPYTTSTQFMSPKEMLSGNDEVIGEVLSILKSQAIPYTAVFTALRPSRVIREVSLAVENLGRSLLQAPPKPAAAPHPPVMYNNTVGPCILLWAENLTMSHVRSGGAPVLFELTSRTFGPGASVSLTDSMCNRTHSRLVLNYGDVEGYKDFKVIFVMNSRHYPVSAQHWFTLDNVEIEYNGLKARFNGSRQIYAPQNYSFHCQSVTSFRNPLLVPFSSSDNATNWRVSFTEFQIQGFNVTGPSFSYASDCAGFFTPGIWMGLLSTLLMVLILTYGLHMLMQLKTMDRFDDPKGASISVPQTE
ncbi:V-type proton ATPase subunit S1-like [Acipenser ruthenus]|uniref:V-type proton ATPase subunit S1-like n=1 Tax=Acipenser ruthenus TaxID=7906 RepID=UPI0027422D7A|nr:V-type proton ATPase subunit S1-like [Acipenser ruthenus]